MSKVPFRTPFCAVMLTRSVGVMRFEVGRRSGSFRISFPAGLEFRAIALVIDGVRCFGDEIFAVEGSGYSLGRAEAPDEHHASGAEIGQADGRSGGRDHPPGMVGETVFGHSRGFVLVANRGIGDLFVTTVEGAGNAILPILVRWTVTAQFGGAGEGALGLAIPAAHGDFGDLV